MQTLGKQGRPAQVLVTWIRTMNMTTDFAGPLHGHGCDSQVKGVVNGHHVSFLLVFPLLFLLVFVRILYQLDYLSKKELLPEFQKN